jgi:hypothetical protein
VFLRPLLMPLDGRSVRLQAESARLEKLCERIRLALEKKKAKAVKGESAGKPCFNSCFEI